MHNQSDGNEGDKAEHGGRNTASLHVTGNFQEGGGSGEDSDDNNDEE